jgi:DNA-binding NtrC family response regulator
MRSRRETDTGLGETAPQTGQLTLPSHSFLRRASATSARVLLVEPDDAQRGHLRDVVRAVAEIDDVADFFNARRRLISKPYDWLLTNIRLGAFNGLQLVHLAETSRRPIRSGVYERHRDIWLAREAQRVGAFYESSGRVDRALPGYFRAALPEQDRRNPAEPDRRIGARGGRRSTDSTPAAASLS